MIRLDGGLQLADCGSKGARVPACRFRPAHCRLRRSGGPASTRRGGRPAARRGISLLEVLISMFIMLVGVISVFSLIALGRFEMLEGSKADRSMSIARSAQREMLARGFLRPVQLDASATAMMPAFIPMWYNASAASAWPTAAWTAGNYTMPFDAQTVAYALDPLGVAVNGATATSFPAYYEGGTTFTSPASPMTRITLRAASSSTFGPMSIGQADAIFRSQDDLVLNPVVGDYPPTQEFSLASGSPTRRQSTGDYSWLATIVPTAGDTKLCIVSIVVFYKRNFILSGAATTPPPPERMVNLTPAPNSSGLGGGEVVLSCPVALTSDYIKVKANQWILLSQTPASAPPGWWRWYRVAATSDPVSSGGNWQRVVTLAGPDWNPYWVVAGNAVTTYASIFDDVIGVYERDVELEESGALWSPN